MALVSCDQASQDVSPIISPSGYATATFTTDFTGSNVSEGDTITYTITLNKMLDRAVTFSVKVNQGPLSMDDIYDEELEEEDQLYSTRMAPYTTEASLSIVFQKDWVYDPAETGTIEIGAFGIAEKNLLNPATVNPKLNLTVSNYVSDILTVSLDWHQPVTVVHIVNKLIDAGGYNVIIRDTIDVAKDASSIDYDFLISLASDFDISDPWASEIGNYSAATGDVPEVMELEGLADGEYVIWYDIYGNALNTVTSPTVFKQYKDSTQMATIVPNFKRQGTALDLDASVDPDVIPPIWAEYYHYYNGVVATVIVADGKYTIEDYEGTTSGPWKYNPSRTPRPDFIKKNK